MPSAAPSLLRNPVFEREFLRFCRTKRWYFIRTALVASLTLVLWLFFLQGQSDITAGNLDAVGRSLFSAACMILVLFVLLATPGMTADLIASERRTGNLEVLLSTPLPRRGIVFGKVLSRVSLILTMVASAFPAISITLLFGGVRGDQVGALFLVSVGLVLGLAGSSIFFSTFAERAGLPAILAYLVALAPGAALLVPADEPGLLVGAVARLALPDPAATPRFGYLDTGFAVLLIGLSGFLLGSALSVLRIRMLRSGHAESVPTSGWRSLGRSAVAWDRGNPISTWESRRVRGRPGRGPFWAVLALLLLAEGAFLLLPSARALLSGPGDHAILVAVECFVILLFAALSGSTTVVSDREQGKIELFRLSDLTPREVVHGKALGTARGLVPLAAIPTLHLLFAGSFTLPALGSVLLFLALLVVAVAICAADGVMNSIQGATVQSAILRSIWHFCWLTLFLPLVQVLLPLVFAGEWNPPEGPQFSLIYPLHHAAGLALGETGSSLDTFGFLFWIVLLAIMGIGLWMLLAQGGFGHRARRRRVPGGPPPLGDWRESWGRLASQWDEED